MGDSERRQLEAAEKYAKDNGFQLDKSLCMIDKGRSGFYGEHLKKGHLGRFLERVENGEVPRNSILVIENIDRLGRERFTNAFKTVSSLIEHGVNIQTLVPYQLYDIESVNSHLIYQLVGQMQRAYEESKRKSELIRAARKNAREIIRETDKKLTARCPAWLQIKEKGDIENKKKYQVEREFIAIPEAKETIQKIFDLKLKGVGKGTIAKKLNAEAVWKPPESKNKKRGGNGWRESYIQKILQNRAVIGEYQPYEINGETGKRKPAGEPIQKYYPQIIDDSIFYAVQNQFKENKGKGGRTGKANNLFRHLVKCAYCGGSMAFVDKGEWKYLICDNGRRGVKCDRHSIRYEECEKVILENCKGLRPEEVLPNPDEQTKLCNSSRQRIQGKEAELRDIEQRIENYDDQIGRTKDRTRRDIYESKILELEQQKKEKDIAKQNDERELAKAESSLQSFTKWQKDLTALQKGMSGNNTELRIRLQYHLRELIEKIEVFATGFQELYDGDKDKDGRPWRNLTKWKAMTKEERKAHRQPKYSDRTEAIADYLYDVVSEADPKLVRSKSFSNFVKDLTKRRMSKEGRFLRIHFKTGVWIDIIPEGSIVSGSKMYIDEEGKTSYKVVSPDIERSWNEFIVKQAAAVD